jgi:hypothetical protein
MAALFPCHHIGTKIVCPNTKRSLLDYRQPLRTAYTPTLCSTSAGFMCLHPVPIGYHSVGSRQYYV